MATEAQIDIDIWSASRIAHFLDYEAKGQLIRKTYFDDPVEIVSPELLRTVASSLLAAGLTTWQAPEYIATLNLTVKEAKTIQQERGDGEPRTMNIAALADAVVAGENVVLYGEGGIGKTTLLLELAGLLLDTERRRIPLYIDAGYWARTNVGILECIAAKPVSLANGVTFKEMMRLARTGCLTIVVNGWNEIQAAQKVVCLQRFDDLITITPDLNVVVVTRSAMDAPNLKAEKQIRVRGLSWQGQCKVIRAEVEVSAADQLIDRLAQDTQLRYAARSPLILKGLIAQAKKGDATLSSVFDLLGAVVATFEENQQRRLPLMESPIYDQHQHYLQELACRLTSTPEIIASRQEALPIISAVADELVKNGHLGGRPAPTEVLDALSNQHLLHTDGQMVRFAHQRFQEYFAAMRLLRACIDGADSDVVFIRQAANQPFWEDAFGLVAGKLKGTTENSSVRSRLVRTALTVDLGFACDLAGACSFSEVDDSELFEKLVTLVTALCDSPLPEVSNYGMACLVSSGFTVFAERIWPLLESDDQSTRLNTYRLSGGGISVAQLGIHAETRIATWTPARQAELMRELADSPDNYDFLVRAANDATDNEVRAAAIFALMWSFPASEAAIRAWLSAPEAVQLDHNVINMIEYALEERDDGEEVFERLKKLASGNATDSTRLQLAFSFPEKFGIYAVDAALARLRDTYRSDDSLPLISIATKHAPEKLKNLARELVLSVRVVPDWACKAAQQESDETRAEIFEVAWTALHDERVRNIDAEAIGQLASRSQTLCCVSEWLIHCRDRPRDLTEGEREQARKLGELLATVSGDDLLAIVMDVGTRASYVEAVELLALIEGRIGQNGNRRLGTTQWLPSIEAVHSLIALFGALSKAEEVAQHRVHISLCSIASLVAPAEFGDLLLDGCRRHLESWATYHALIGIRSNGSSGQRPNNPALGLFLINALERWGFEAVPHLLALIGDPHANELIPEALKRIVSKLWENNREGPFHNFEGDIKDGEQRRSAKRELRQPDDIHQSVTDAVAIALGKKLTELVQHHWEEKTAAGHKWNEKQAAYQMSRLLGAIANTPSPKIAEPLMHALAHGFTDIYSAVGALKSFVRQGALIEEPAVVARIETIFHAEAKAKWFDNDMKCAMSELIQLLFFVQPVNLLSRPLVDYVVEWQRFAYINEIIRRLGVIPSPATWGCLVSLGKSCSAQGQPPEDLTFALSTSLRLANFTEFLELIADGTWFAWCQNTWNLKHVSPRIIEIIGKDAARLDAFLAACGRSGSPLADGFACAVLASMPNGDAIRLRYGLAALDASKAEGSRSSAYQMLKDMFTLTVPLGVAGQYDQQPKACNELRRELYARSKEEGHTAITCRRLLADLEGQRREYGRPADESRHPALPDGIAWTEALAISD